MLKVKYLRESASILHPMPLHLDLLVFFARTLTASAAAQGAAFSADIVADIVVLLLEFVTFWRPMTIDFRLLLLLAFRLQLFTRTDHFGERTGLAIWTMIVLFAVSVLERTLLALLFDKFVFLAPHVLLNDRVVVDEADVRRQLDSLLLLLHLVLRWA